ncbi:electron transfer flavoprotein subunit beta [bacterium]|nr:MAG: electron transfer flavoprotein subunit beta [bacterium]RKZ13590.1 MAG: electron transfer flavoprotein subunit beta [bacterium]
MKILVCVKQVPEQDARLRIAGDESWIVEDGLSFAISECDRYGVEAALRLKEAGEAEVVVLSLGGERASKGIKEALAMGCDRAIHVNSDALQTADAITIAKVLAAAARDEAADLIICGQQSDDLSYNAVGPALAQFLDMRHVQIALELEMAGDAAIKVSHELDNNLIETVELQLPAVIGVQSGINDVRYASLKGIMQAGAKPQTKTTLEELGLDDAAVAPKLKIEKVGFPVRTSQAEMLEGDAKEVATQLVQKLINDAKVL